MTGNWVGFFLLHQRFKRKPGNYPIFEEAFGQAQVTVPTQDRPVLLMSEQGLGDTLQFARYALALQNQGVDVTVLSQSPLVELLCNSVGLHKVDDCLNLNSNNSGIQFGYH